jgi:hypothetical protein
MDVDMPFVIPFEESASLVYSLVFMVLRKVSERNASHSVFIMKGIYEYVIIYNLLRKYSNRERMKPALKVRIKKDL